MKKPAPTSAPAAKTLAEQKTDFTAEGSPPPGKVSTASPIGSAAGGTAQSQPLLSRPQARLKRAAGSAGP
jgi:hypothetical protein